MLGRPALERLSAACDVLMGRIGDASMIAVAEQALAAYAELDESEKMQFWELLRDHFASDPADIRKAFAAYDKEPTEERLVPLFQSVEPLRQTLLRRLNTAPGATRLLVDMRADLLAALRKDPSLRPLDADFAHLFASWFNRGFLRMQRITWASPAVVLEKIMAYESVHPMQGWEDLRRRLDQHDRRIYAFFHPATGEEPLIFVEVALMNETPSQIAPILTAPPARGGSEPDTAVFYSINNTLRGLKGVSFGNFLIKQVVKELAAELPSLRTFVTLSPVPGFARWLASNQSPAAVSLRQELQGDLWIDDARIASRIAPGVEQLAAAYLTEAKHQSGAPLDPVARFHLGNGAACWRVNWPGDLSTGGISGAHAVMVNYLYEADQIELRHEAYVREGVVAVGKPLSAVLASKKRQEIRV